MNIEQELHDVGVRHTSRDHQRLLRGALLAHLEEVQTVKNTKYSRNAFVLRRLMPVGLTLVLAVALITGAMFIPRSQNTSGSNQNKQGTVAKLTGVLTPAQVMAAAANYADQNKANAGMYTYQKARVYQPVIGCSPDTEYQETWTDMNGKEVQYRRSNSKDVTIQFINFTDPSTQYFNQGALDLGSMDMQKNECPQRPYITDEEYTKWLAHAQAIAKAYGYIGTEAKPLEAGGKMYLGDLRSGNAQLQAQAFRKLQGIGGWSVTNDVVNKDFSSAKLVKLSFTYGWAYENLYFDQATARFVGFESDEPLSTYTRYVVLTQSTVSNLDYKK